MDPTRSDSAIGAVSPVTATPAVRPMRAGSGVGLPGEQGGQYSPGVAAVTAGSLPASYAQFVVNPDTHDVVIQVKDAVSDQVLSEYPSREVEAMAAHMRQYADLLARRRAAALNSGKQG